MQPRFNEALSNRCKLLQACWQRTEAVKRRGESSCFVLKKKKKEIDLSWIFGGPEGENLVDEDSDCSEEEEESSSSVDAEFVVGSAGEVEFRSSVSDSRGRVVGDSRGRGSGVGDSRGRG